MNCVCNNLKKSFRNKCNKLMDRTPEFITFFKKELHKAYIELTEKNIEIIQRMYIDVISKLDNKKRKLTLLSYICQIGVYIIVLLIMTVPYFLWLVSIFTSTDEDKASKHINVVITIFLIIYSIVYENLDFKKKIVIYDQTLMRLKKEGLKFLDRKHDDRYGDLKRPKESDKLDKFLTKINTKIDLAVIKFEDYSDISLHEDSRHSKKYSIDNYNGYGGYFFEINNNVNKELDEEKNKYSLLEIEDIIIEKKKKNEMGDKYSVLGIEDVRGTGSVVEIKLEESEIIDNDSTEEISIEDNREIIDDDSTEEISLEDNREIIDDDSTEEFVLEENEEIIDPIEEHALNVSDEENNKEINQE